MLWKKSKEEEYRGGPILNSVMKEGHIGEGNIWSKPHRYHERTADDSKKREQWVQSTGHIWERSKKLVNLEWKEYGKKHRKLNWRE